MEPLHERGIYPSVSQVHRLAICTPERLSLQVLAALCDIFATVSPLRETDPHWWTSLVDVGGRQAYASCLHPGPAGSLPD
nr:helix-turn-helix domain-containing protein [Amycolatopsis pretoriensis]